MANIPRWRGSKLTDLEPGYPKTIQTASGERTELVYNGPYTTLRATRPKTGQKIAGYASGLVEQTEVWPDGVGVNGPGKLRVLLVDEGTPADMVTSGGSDIIYEIEFVDLGKSLRQHPRYDGTAGQGNAFGGTRLSTGVVLIGGTATPLGAILDDMLQSNIADRNTLVNKVPAGQSLDLLLDIEKKIKSGQESYIAPAPIARKTTRSYLRPTTTKMGKRLGGKPFPDAPNGYEWLTTADKATKTGGKGRWERTEEFTGADSWDHDIYPAGG